MGATDYTCFFLLGAVISAGICTLVFLGITTWQYDLAEKWSRDRLKKYTFDKAAVAADNQICSDIGRDILQGSNTVGKPGSAADAAIAAMICTSVINCHSSGIGGGHFSLVYDRVSGNVTAITAREKAPLSAYRDMYLDHPEYSKKGGLAVAVPGELKGFYELWQRNGRLDWSSLFEPSIKLARIGFQIGGSLAFAIKKNEHYILNNTNLRELFTNTDGQILQKGDHVTLTKLADTLAFIAYNGTVDFYEGELAETIAEEIRNATPANETAVTVEDLRQYDVRVEEALRVPYNKLTMYSAPPPASGALTSFIINIIEGYYMTPCSKTSNTDCYRALQYHRMVEAFKFAYAGRAELKDGASQDIVDTFLSKEHSDTIRRRISDDTTQEPSYYNGNDTILGLYEEGGTAHVSVIDEFGNAVAISCSINTYFGSHVVGSKTGIFYNNQMDDFSFNDPLTENSIEPGKRPLSSMTPLIFLDEDGYVRLVTGGAGSLSILTATSLVVSNSLWFKDDIYMSQGRARLHYPYRGTSYVAYESDTKDDIVEGLKQRGHNITEHNSKDNGPMSVIQLITKDDTNIYAKSDNRKPGHGEAGF